MNVEEPPWTWHGGNLTAAAMHFGGDAHDWIDLSTGINPEPWPVPPGQTIDWHRLPAPAALATLERAAARHFAVTSDCVCAVPGSEVGLRLVGQLIGAAGASFTHHPCYRTHRAMIEGTRPLPIARLAEADGATLVLANPTNPDGHRFSLQELDALLTRRGAAGWLVLDEAFADAFEEPGLGARVCALQRLIVLRSFGKFYGLAGLRLGFVIAPPEILVRLRALLGSWPLSAGAIAIGTAAYTDRAWIVRTRTRLRAQADRLDVLLRRHGLEPLGACPLFRLVRVRNAAALFDHLAHSAILTRPFDEDRTALRLGLPANPEAFARLDASLRGWRPDNG